MASVANTVDVSVGDNAGQVGAGSEFDVKGGLGKTSSLGNTVGIEVGGKNTATGCIGAGNKYELKGGAGGSIGNTAVVTVKGDNSGAIGSGNKVNIS